MPFRLTHLCDLFQKLEDHYTHDPPLPPPKLKSLMGQTIREWFQNHRARLDVSHASSAAFLSACFPERRTDRVYNIREKSLVKILGRVLGLSLARRKSLEDWCKPGRGDLGACVERVQREAEMPIPLAGHEVTLEEIDAAFAALASQCRFSSPAVRQSTAHDSHQNPIDLLRPLFHRLRSRDAKWLTRMLLKNYSPLIVPEYLILAQYHFMLPELLKFQSSFEAAVTLLRGPDIIRFPMHPQEEGQRESMRQAILQQLKPKVGVKVGRTAFFKARSIKHCLEMVRQQRMSLERKYDGEYCQIHVDLASKHNWLQIFSKSGKDSTADRRGIHQTIRDCLRIDQPGRGFSVKCILEGELVVYSDKDKRILEFHKLRKHVSRSGCFLGTERHSQPHEHEHLMIILYDILLVDDSPILAKNYNERKGVLDSVVREIPGRAQLAWRKQISFRSPNAAARLRRNFARGIGRRWEGFVLKPIDQPYFGLGAGQTGYWIKLKKDYIKGLGDSADFAVVGAGFGAGNTKAKDKDLPWTHFHIGCLQNREEALRFGDKPRWRVIQSVNECINKEDLKTLNHVGQFHSEIFGGQTMCQEFDLIMDLSQEDCKMDVVFRQPFVFDIMGGGFVKPPGKRFYTLRWPRVEKIHWDRTWTDTISFEELQKMATEAVTAPESGASQEELAWIERLEAADMGQRRTEAMRADSSWQAGEASESGDIDDMDTTQTTSLSSHPSTNVDKPGSGPPHLPIESRLPGDVACLSRSETRPPLPTPPLSDPALASIAKVYSSAETVKAQKIQKGKEDDEVQKPAELAQYTSSERGRAGSTDPPFQPKEGKDPSSRASIPSEATTMQEGKIFYPPDSTNPLSMEKPDASLRGFSREPIWAGDARATRLYSPLNSRAASLIPPTGEMANSSRMTQDTRSEKRKAADAGDDPLRTKKRKGPTAQSPTLSETTTVQKSEQGDKVASSAEAVQNTSPRKRKAADTDDASLLTKKTKVASNTKQARDLTSRMDQSAQATSSTPVELSNPLADIINGSDIRPRPSQRTGHKSIPSGDSHSVADPAKEMDRFVETTLHTTAQATTPAAPTRRPSSNQENYDSSTGTPSSSTNGIPPRSAPTGILTSTCTVKGARCKLADTIALLSPCVAQMPYLTEDMLPRHGISFTVDPNDLASVDNRDKKKIVLVETHRADPTAETIDRVTSLDLLPSIDVAVFDWRVLECLAREERDGDGSLEMDHWARCFVCAV
ncbi:MAG: hypothetical protein M1816_007675 [Peltula sp. TS41687]|nr:MAG: hypothetical protein M1816_007675 [Peltula sp. TS41687]